MIDNLREAAQRMNLKDALAWALPIVEQHIRGQANVYPESLRRLREAKSALEREGPPEPEHCIRCHRIPDPSFSSRNPALTICRECWVGGALCEPPAPSIEAHVIMARVRDALYAAYQMGAEGNRPALRHLDGVLHQFLGRAGFPQRGPNG